MSLFVDPRTVLDTISLSPGMYVADIGCGVGHYTFAAAERLEGKGRIYAIDIRKQVLDKVAAEANERHVPIVEVIWGDVEKENGTRLADNTVQAAIASNIFFQVEDKVAVAREISRILAPGGELLVVDWSDSFGGLGPAPEHIVSAEDIENVCKEASLASVNERTSAGSHHYTLVFKRT